MMELSHVICENHPVFCCGSSIEYCYTRNGRFLSLKKEWFYLGVRERILAIRIMEKLRKFPEQVDALGIVAVNGLCILRERSGAEPEVIKN